MFRSRQIRKTIAKRLVQSIGPIPTFYLTTEVDMERVWEAREALNAGARKGGEAESPKISFNDIVIKAVASALRQHPACNAWWQDDHIRYWNEVHVEHGGGRRGRPHHPGDPLYRPEDAAADLRSSRATWRRGPASGAWRRPSIPAAPSRFPTSACSISTSSPR